MLLQRKDYFNFKIFTPKIHFKIVRFFPRCQFGARFWMKKRNFWLKNIQEIFLLQQEHPLIIIDVAMYNLINRLLTHYDKKALGADDRGSYNFGRDINCNISLLPLWH